MMLIGDDDIEVFLILLYKQVIHVICNKMSGNDVRPTSLYRRRRDVAKMTFWV